MKIWHVLVTSYRIYLNIRRVFETKNEAKTRGFYMRLQKCIEVNGHLIADVRSSLGGRLICEVDL